MPGSAIGSGLVDFSLSPQEIAEELARIAQHPYLGEKAAVGPAQGAQTKPKDVLTENEKDMGRLFALLRARTNADFSFYRHSTLKRRIMRQMILQKLHSLSEYVEFLGKHAEEVDKLFNDLLINVTSFFRDNNAFQLLKKKIFPRLLKLHRDDSPL